MECSRRTRARGTGRRARAHRARARAAWARLMNTLQIVLKSSPVMDKSSRGCTNKTHYNWPRNHRGYNVDAVPTNLLPLWWFLVPIRYQFDAMLVNIPKIVPKSSPMMDISSKASLHKTHYNWPRDHRGYNVDAVPTNLPPL